MRSRAACVFIGAVLLFVVAPRPRADARMAGTEPAGQPGASRSAAAASGALAAEPEARSLEAARAAGPERDARVLRRGSSLRQGSASGPAGSGVWTRTVGWLAAIVALIVLLAWLYRWLGPMRDRVGLVVGPRRGGLMELVGRLSLSGRHVLYLVRVGPRMVLVGAGHDSLRALDVIADADLTAALAGQAETSRNGSISAEFRRCLEDFRGSTDRGAGANGSVGAAAALPEHGLRQAAQAVRRARDRVRSAAAL